VTRPLVRDGGDPVATDWDTVPDIVAEPFGTALRASRDGVAMLGSGQQTNEAAYALGKLARGGFKARYYDVLPRGTSRLFSSPKR
jgi:assimilatory nitrate reductase catalytic subunit